MIHRLMTVYTTINAIVGYWLAVAVGRSGNVRAAKTWDRYTASMWPTTMTATDRNHNTLALITPGSTG